MNGFGWQRPRFMPLAGTGWNTLPGNGRRSMGQMVAEWQKRAEDAASKYRDLVKRMTDLTDEKAKAAIQDWLGKTGVLATPADRYKAVSDALATGPVWDEVMTKRVTDLEDAVREFESRVADAEKTTGTVNPARQPAQTASPQGALTPVGLALGLTAILGLLVLPLVIE